MMDIDSKLLFIIHPAINIGKIPSLWAVDLRL